LGLKRFKQPSCSKSGLDKRGQLIAYVFLVYPRKEDRQIRMAELRSRCFVVRGITEDCKTVVGISTEEKTQEKEFSSDVIHIHKPEWTEEDQKHCNMLQTEFGYFTKPRIQRSSEDEYPRNQVVI